MSSLPKKQPTLNSIMGIPIIGLPTAINNTLQFDNATETFVWVVAGGFDGAHTSLTDKEVAGVIDHADDSINAAKLKTNSVIEAKINALAVTVGKIGALAVTEAKIAALAVTEGKLGALAVSLAKMKTEAGNANLFIGYDGTGIVVAKAGGGGGLGDLEFLRDKELAGDLVKANGIFITAGAGVAVSIVPASGKTFFLANGSQTFNNDNGADTSVEGSVINNVTTRESYFLRMLAQTSEIHPIKVEGDSLVGDGAVNYSIEKISGLVNMKVIGVLIGWIQNT